MDVLVFFNDKLQVLTFINNRKTTNILSCKRREKISGGCVKMKCPQEVGR